MKKTALISWSTGKDSAWSLYNILNNQDVIVKGLFCTINSEFSRTAMHGVRVELLKKQAEAVGLPLDIIEVPYPCSNKMYETIMQDFVNKTQEQKIDCFVFGDLFLKDIRSYREDNLKQTGIKPIFPLWEIPTDKLAKEMIDSGLKTIITCIDPKKLSKEFVGRGFDHDFIRDLPDDVDPCGENGEFHSFVYDAPFFQNKISIKVGEIVEREGFIYADIFPS